MSAEAALQQLRGLVAALGAGAVLREDKVSALRTSANAVVRHAREAEARDGGDAPELARGSWEAALELWCAA